jgi:hypothetical protein
MRADIHDGSEHNTLQSEAGYIDARPHIRQIDETLLQRAAGPYIGVMNGGSWRARITSASPQSSDVGGARWHVAFVPVGVMDHRSFQHAVGAY